MTAADRPTEPRECLDDAEATVVDGWCVHVGFRHVGPCPPVPAAEDDAVLDRKPVRNHPDVESPAPNVATSEGRDKAVATSGEQPGPLKAGVMALTGLSSDEVDALGGVREDDRPAPVVPDSPDVREVLDEWRKVVRIESPDDGVRVPVRDLAAVLAVVGQGVTAEQAWDEGFADGKRHAFEGDDGPRFVNPYRAVVRSGEQGGDA